MKKTVTFSLIIALGLVACGKKTADKTADAVSPKVDTGPVEPTEILGIAMVEPAGRLVSLASEQSGVVRKVFGAIGQQLKAGSPILELDASLETAQLEQAKSRIGTQQQAIDAARENLRLVQVKRDKARADLARDEALFKGNAITRQQVEDSRALMPDLDQQLKAQEALLRQQEAKMKEFQADIHYYQTLVGQRTVRAPSDGILLSIDIRQGEYLDARTSFGEYAPAGPVVAVTEIDELFADRVHPGQTAVISPQGSNRVLTTGKVVLTSPYLRKKSLFSEKAGDLEDRRVREVRIQIDEPDKVLLGSRVECKIQL